MKTLILFINLTLVFLCSCSKEDAERESGISLDTSFDLYVKDAQGKDLLATTGSEFLKLEVFDKTAGEVSKLAPNQQSYLLIKPEGNDPDHRIRVYFDPKFERSELELRWDNGEKELFIGEVTKFASGSATRTKVYHKNTLIFDAAVNQGPPIYTITK